MKDLLKSVIITAGIMAVLSFPVEDDVTIIKDDIKSNHPFAGKIDGKIVGTDICIKYWLSKNDMPDSAIYKVSYPLVFGHLGFIYKLKQIK